MQQESRVKKTLLNARVNLIFYFLTLILSFFSRKIFLDCLGAEFIGLTSSLGSLLGFLNLAELGIGSAIGYVLYKPLFEQNHQNINEIISVLGYLYRRIGITILILGSILSLFLPSIYSNANFGYGIILFTFFSFLSSSLIGYFINYRQTLLGADQRNYVVTAYFQTAGLCKTLIQMLLAFYSGNYYLWAAIELVFGIIYAIILNWKINQVYPWLKSDIRLGKTLHRKYPEVMKYTKQLFVHKIGEVTLGQVTTLLVYAFGSLQSVAYYGNYTIITSKIFGLIGNFLGSTTASIGNLIAEGERKKTLNIFWELTAIYFYISSVCAIALYHLTPPFITLWLGAEYIMTNRILIIIIISFCLSLLRSPISQFKFGYGLFSDIWSPIAESIILIIVAVCGGYIWGLEGVLLGSVVSTVLIIFGWQAFFLFSKGFQKTFWLYAYNYGKNIIVMMLSFTLTNKVLINLPVTNAQDSWLQWIIYAVEIIITQGFISLILMATFIPGMRFFIKRFLQRL